MCISSRSKMTHLSHSVQESSLAALISINLSREIYACFDIVVVISERPLGRESQNARGPDELIGTTGFGVITKGHMQLQYKINANWWLTRAWYTSMQSLIVSGWHMFFGFLMGASICCSQLQEILWNGSLGAFSNSDLQSSDEIILVRSLCVGWSRVTPQTSLDSFIWSFRHSSCFFSVLCSWQSCRNQSTRTGMGWNLPRKCLYRTYPAHKIVHCTHLRVGVTGRCWFALHGILHPTYLQCQCEALRNALRAMRASLVIRHKKETHALCCAWWLLTQTDCQQRLYGHLGIQNKH